MPWYYVGPDAKPVGPLSLEELQSRRLSGALSPETYVIEASAQNAPKEWRRYRELFPASTVLPPLPPVPATDSPASLLPSSIFPTSVPASTVHSPGGPVFTGTHPSIYNAPPPSLHRTNACCAWGFGLGLAGLPLLICGGAGLFLALAGLVVSVIGLVQVQRKREQSGRGLAIAGIVTSLLTLLIVVIIGAAWAFSNFKSSVQMTTEQTSNDTDSR